MQKPPEMTTAVALENILRLALAEGTTSLGQTWERTCWKSRELFFRSVKVVGSFVWTCTDLLFISKPTLRRLLELYYFSPRPKRREIITSSISSAPPPVYQSLKTWASVSPTATHFSKTYTYIVLVWSIRFGWFFARTVWFHQHWQFAFKSCIKMNIFFFLGRRFQLQCFKQCTTQCFDPTCLSNV